MDFSKIRFYFSRFHNETISLFLRKINLMNPSYTTFPRIFTSIIFTLFVGCQAFAQAKYSNEYLAIGVGARAQAMGNAQISEVNDVSAIYWNPAGLVNLEAPFQVMAMHTELFAGIAKYDYIGFAKTLNKEKKSTIGLSVVRLGIDNIPNTLNLVGPDGTINYDNITEFSTADYAVFMSYGRQLNDKLSVGGNVKVIRRVIGEFGNAWGFGIDLGLQYKVKDWRFALMGRDITSTFNAWSFDATEEQKQVFIATGNDVLESSVEITRPRFILGAAWTKQFGEKIDFLIEANFDITTDGQRNVLISSSSFNVDPHAGFEIGYNDFIFLRGGVMNFQDVKTNAGDDSTTLSVQPNFGIGLKLGKFILDYAYTNIGGVSEVNYSNVFSLKLNFDGKAK